MSENTQEKLWYYVGFVFGRHLGHPSKRERLQKEFYIIPRGEVDKKYNH